jgi:hypothetical protein
MASPARAASATVTSSPSTPVRSSTAAWGRRAQLPGGQCAGAHEGAGRGNAQCHVRGIAAARVATTMGDIPPPPSRTWRDLMATASCARSSATASALRCMKSRRSRTTVPGPVAAGWKAGTVPGHRADVSRSVRTRYAVRATAWTVANRRRFACRPLGKHHRHHRRWPAHPHRARARPGATDRAPAKGGSVAGDSASQQALLP